MSGQQKKKKIPWGRDEKLKIVEILVGSVTIIFAAIISVVGINIVMNNVYELYINYVSSPNISIDTRDYGTGKP